MITFGEILYQVLKENGISQKELSERTGITRSAICRYCSDTMEPNLKNFYLICKALDLYVPEVLQWMYGQKEEV